MILGDGRGTGPSSLNERMASTVYKTFQLLANYNVQFKKHDIMALAGYAWEDEGSRNMSGSRKNSLQMTLHIWMLVEQMVN